METVNVILEIMKLVVDNTALLAAFITSIGILAAAAYALYKKVIGLRDANSALQVVTSAVDDTVKVDLYDDPKKNEEVKELKNLVIKAVKAGVAYRLENARPNAKVKIDEILAKAKAKAKAETEDVKNK